jgi:protein-tyrosine phosphatase
MARTAVGHGIETIAATPHLRADFPQVHVEEIAQRCELLRTALTRDGIPLRIVAGAEASLPWALDADEKALALASYGQLGTDLLIETPAQPSLLEGLLGAVQGQGFRVTLAHPERSQALYRRPERIDALREQGVLLQINAGALLARSGSATRKFAEHLCRSGLADVLASDGHRGFSWRPVTDLTQGVQAAVRLVGAARANWMASEAPAAILSGTELPPAPPVEPRQGRRWRRA